MLTKTYVTKMTTPGEFNLTIVLEEIYNNTGKMQIVTGQESKFEQMLHKYIKLWGDKTEKTRETNKAV